MIQWLRAQHHPEHVGCDGSSLEESSTFTRTTLVEHPDRHFTTVSCLLARLDVGTARLRTTATITLSPFALADNSDVELALEKTRRTLTRARVRDDGGGESRMLTLKLRLVYVEFDLSVDAFEGYVSPGYTRLPGEIDCE